MKNKYRIKKITYSDGLVKYLPQYKFLFMWFDYSEYYCGSDTTFSVKFDTFNQAKNYLYNYSNKVINTEYLNIDC